MRHFPASAAGRTFRKRRGGMCCFIEEAVGCPITYVSVGPERDSIILRGRNNA